MLLFQQAADRTTADRRPGPPPDVSDLCSKRNMKLLCIISAGALPATFVRSLRDESRHQTALHFEISKKSGVEIGLVRLRHNIQLFSYKHRQNIPDRGRKAPDDPHPLPFFQLIHRRLFAAALRA